MTAFPVPRSSRDEYEVRMHRVLAYIDKNLVQAFGASPTAWRAHSMRERALLR